MTELVLASAFAWCCWASVLTAAQIVGGSLILAGVILAETARTADRAAPTPPTQPTAAGHAQARRTEPTGWPCTPTSRPSRTR